MTPDCAAQPRRVLEGKQAGRGFTAARQRASRLAGLVGFPVTIAHRPPWHDRCHGSRVWSLEMEQVVYRKRMGDGVCGSYKDGAYRESEEYGPP